MPTQNLAPYWHLLTDAHKKRLASSYKLASQAEVIFLSRSEVLLRARANAKFWSLQRKTAIADETLPSGHTPKTLADLWWSLLNILEQPIGALGNLPQEENDVQN